MDRLDASLRLLVPVKDIFDTYRLDKYNRREIKFEKKRFRDEIKTVSLERGTRWESSTILAKTSRIKHFSSVQSWRNNNAPNRGRFIAGWRFRSFPRVKKKAKEKQPRRKLSYLTVTSLDGFARLKKKSKRRVVTRVYLFLWWKIAGPIYIPSSNCPLSPSLSSGISIRITEKTFPGEKGGGRNSLRGCETLFRLAMETAPWRGKREWGEKKVDTVIIRTKFLVKIAIGGMNCGRKLSNYAIMGLELYDGARSSWLTVLPCILRTILDDVYLLLLHFFR